MNDWFLATSMFMASAVTVTTQLVLNYNIQNSAGYGILVSILAFVCYVKYLKEIKNDNL